MILQEKMERIKSILKKEPKGLTISDLSHRINLNRNSLAKYLEILLVTGQVEMESFGTAKVYCLSQRVPVTALLQFASDLIAMVDEDCTFIQVNDHFLAFFGVKKENLLGKQVNECTLRPITDEPLMPLIRQAQEHGEISREIQWMQNGEAVYLREKIVPTVFDNGNRGAVLIIENTTKQRQYETRLAESEEKYRALAENTLDGIMILRFDGTVLYANRAMVRMVDLDDAAEAIHLNVYDFVAPASRERVREDLRHMEQGAAGYLATYPVITASGRECWLECLSTTINYQGEPVNISSVRDITDRLRADRELIIRGNAMAASIGGMAVFDQSQVLVYANPAFLDLFRFHDEREVLGRNVYDLIRGGEMIDGILDEIRGALAERGIWSGEVYYPEKDGYPGRSLRVSTKNVTDVAGTLICTVASFADVTEQKAMERAFRRTYGKLQETIEFMPDPTFIVNQEKEVVAWNRPMETLTGTSKTAILQNRDYHSAFSFYQGYRPVLIDLIDLPAEELGRTYPVVRKVGDSIFLEAYLPHLNQGKGAYLWGKASRLTDENGRSIGAIESVRDITEWKRAEESLRRAYQQAQNNARIE